MTIDEAIAHAREVATNESCEKCAEEHEQLAKWLEELKIFQELYPDTDVKSSLQKNYQQGRVDAIEECIKFVDEWDSVIADALVKNMM